MCVVETIKRLKENNKIKMWFLFGLSLFIWVTIIKNKTKSSAVFCNKKIGKPYIPVSGEFYNHTQTEWIENSKF